MKGVCAKLITNPDLSGARRSFVQCRKIMTRVSFEGPSSCSRSSDRWPLANPGDLIREVFCRTVWYLGRIRRIAVPTQLVEATSSSNRKSKSSCPRTASFTRLDNRPVPDEPVLDRVLGECPSTIGLAYIDDRKCAHRFF